MITTTFHGRVPILGAVAVASCLTAACAMEAARPERERAVIFDGRGLEEDLLAAGDQVQLRTSIDGDVIAAGGRVTIAGPVDGYAIAAGRTVGVTRRVSNDVLAAGNAVTVDGEVGDRAILAGRTVRLRPAADVGTAIIGAGTAEIQGRVRRDLTIGAESARISGRVGGSVDARADRVAVLPGAVIEGNLVVRASAPPEISPQARILGTVDYRETTRAPWTQWVWRWAWLFLAILALGLATVVVRPAWARRVGTTMESRPLASVLTGLTGAVAFPIFAVLLFMTVIGIPLGVLVVGLYVAALLFATAFVAYEIGHCIVRWVGRSRPGPSTRRGTLGRTAVGAFALSLALATPAVGWIVQLAVVVLGLGAVLIERWRFGRDLETAGFA